MKKVTPYVDRDRDYNPPPAELDEVIECEVRLGNRDSNDILAMLVAMREKGQILIEGNNGAWKKAVPAMILRVIEQIGLERTRVFAPEVVDKNADSRFEIGDILPATVMQVAPGNFCIVRGGNGNGHSIKNLHLLGFHKWRERDTDSAGKSENHAQTRQGS